MMPGLHLQQRILLKVAEQRSQKASEFTIQLSLLSFLSAGQNIVSNSVRMHHLVSLLLNISLQVKQNIVSNNGIVLVLKCSLQIQNIVSNTVRMHHLPSLFSFSYLHFQIILKYHQSASFKDIFLFSAVQNNFHCRQNACLRDKVFQNLLCIIKSFQIPSRCLLQKHCFHFFSLQFQIISNTVRMHVLETLFSKFSLQFQIVSNSTRMYALETLLSFFCTSKSFQKPSKCML